MLVFIPSSGRADIRLMRGPLQHMSPYWQEFTSIVVPSGQQDVYRSQLDKYGYGDVRVIPCPDKGIAATRWFIGKYVAAQSENKFVMLDDDIKFLIRIKEDSWQLRNSDRNDVSEALWWVNKKLDSYAHVSLSAREGNNRGPTGGPEVSFHENTRTLRCLAYQVKPFLAMEHCRVQVMEDFDVNLQLLREGYKNISSFYYAQGQRKTNEEGGCSAYRTHEVHELSAKDLLRLHPGFVRLREKQNKTDADGFGHRTEVTISWQKAWQSSTTPR